MRGARVKSRTCFQFIAKIWFLPEPCGASLPKKPDLDPMSDHHGGRKSVGAASTSNNDSWKSGSWGAMLFHMSYSLHHLHLMFRLVAFLNSWINKEVLLLIGLCAL